MNESVLMQVMEKIKPYLGSGKVADYIPALAKVNPYKFGIAVATVDGGCYGAGDYEEAFSIQSISKVFALAMVMEKVRDEELWRRVWREPSGSAFNSLVQLEYEHGIPRNPFINAGAIVVSDMLLSLYGPNAKAELIGFFQKLSRNKTVGYDEEVAVSEKDHGKRNRALANFIDSFANLNNTPEDVLDLYFHQCAVSMSAMDMAQCGLFLADDGFDPVLNERIMTLAHSRRINALMLTCGHYDASGDFAFKVGLPGKSGVGGGILVIVPGKMSIAVWSPPLNRYGNSLAGTKALEFLVEETGYSIFKSHRLD